MHKQVIFNIVSGKIPIFTENFGRIVKLFSSEAVVNCQCCSNQYSTGGMCGCALFFIRHTFLHSFCNVL